LTYSSTLSFLLIAFLNQEPASGIYIVASPGKKIACEHELKMLIGKAKVCLSKKPIITIGEIESVTDIKYQPKIESHYLDVRFSPKGIQTLNTAIRSLPQTQFALVSRNEVVCIFTVEPEAYIDFIRIGIGEDLADLKVVHSALKEIVP
jgi:hypothetical protein